MFHSAPLRQRWLLSRAMVLLPLICTVAVSASCAGYDAQAASQRLPTIIVPTRDPKASPLPTAVPITPAPTVQLDEPWPPFVLTYRETGVQFPSGNVRIQVMRLEYRDRHHFREVLLSHNHRPDVVGSWWQLAGNEVRSHDPRTPGEKMSTLRPGEPLPGPGGWLEPGLMQHFGTVPGMQRRVASEGFVVFARDEAWDGHTGLTETTFRQSDGIPTLQVETVDGIEVERYEMIDLQIGAAALEQVMLTPLPTAAPMIVPTARATTRVTPSASVTAAPSTNSPPPVPAVVTVVAVPAAPMTTPGRH